MQNPVVTAGRRHKQRAIQRNHFKEGCAALNLEINIKGRFALALAGSGNSRPLRQRLIRVQLVRNCSFSRCIKNTKIIAFKA